MDQNGQATPLLVAERVRKVYRTGGVEVEALAGLDLTVRGGELVGAEGHLRVTYGTPAQNARFLSELGALL